MQLRSGLALAVAVAQAGSYNSDLMLAWEPPQATSEALKKKKKKKKLLSIIFCSFNSEALYTLPLNYFLHLIFSNAIINL